MDRRLLGRWVLANATGELLGLGVAAAAGALLVAALGGSDDPVRALAVALAMIALGALEGLTVGVAQFVALRRALPALSGWQWARATIAGAAVAWALGMIPSTAAAFLHPSDTAAAPNAMPPRAVILALAAGLGLVAGPVLAAFQVRVLRAHVPHAMAWLPANALAWALGMPMIFELVHVVATRHLAWPAAAATIGFGLAGVGAVVGLVHGFALVRLVGGARAA